MANRDQYNLDRLFTNMKVISRIRQHERCNTNDGASVRIDSNGLLQGVRRWWHGEDREKNLVHIEHIMSQAFEQLSMALVDPKTESKKTGRVAFLTRIRKEMNATCEGLNNLRATYETDSVIIARIDVLVERIQANVAIADEVLKNTEEKEKEEKEEEEK